MVIQQCAILLVLVLLVVAAAAAADQLLCRGSGITIALIGGSWSGGLFVQFFNVDGHTQVNDLHQTDASCDSGFLKFAVFQLLHSNL